MSEFHKKIDKTRNSVKEEKRGYFGHAYGVRVQKVQSPMVRLQVKF